MVIWSCCINNGSHCFCHGISFYTTARCLVLSATLLIRQRVIHRCQDVTETLGKCTCNTGSMTPNSMFKFPGNFYGNRLGVQNTFHKNLRSADHAYSMSDRPCPSCEHGSVLQTPGRQPCLRQILFPLTCPLGCPLGVTRP